MIDLEKHGEFDLTKLNDEEVKDLGIACYLEDYIDKGKTAGSLIAHDGEKVVFFADRSHHALNTSSDHARRAFSKDKVDRQRVARVEWIKIIIEGRAKDTECWEVPLRVPEEGQRPFPGKRAYVSWNFCYLIWLEPLKNGGYKFSSTYCPNKKQLAKYLERAKRIWAKT